MGKGIVEDYAALRVGSLISARYRRDGRARRQRAGLPPGVVDGLTRDEAGVPRLVDGSAALEVVAKMPGGRQRLSVAATLCHFGGSRLWVVCDANDRLCWSQWRTQREATWTQMPNVHSH